MAAIHQRYRQDDGPVAYGEPLLVMVTQKLQPGLVALCMTSGLEMEKAAAGPTWAINQ